MIENAPTAVDRNAHPADLADHLQRLDPDQARALIRDLPADVAGAALADVEEEKLPELLALFEPVQMAELVKGLPPADAADLLQHVPPLKRREALGAMPPETALGIRILLRYPEDTAGGIMSNRFISLRDDMTVEGARELLRTRAQEERTDDIAYLYVTDTERRLIGIVSLRDLVFRRSDRLIRDILTRDVKFVRTTDDQEELARMFDHYHYLGLPVLDEEDRLVGVVKASDALEVARKEATEDMQLMVGLSGDESTLTPWKVSMRRRLPWLYINLATAFLAAFVVGLFEETIAKWTALAIFLPIVAGQGGNAGMQTLTVIIRDMALGELPPGEGRKALIKEITLGIVNGLAIAVVVALIAWFWKNSLTLAFVAGAAMLLNQVMAGFSGVLIPFTLKKLRVDPALASSIFLTTVTDVAGFFFFLGLAFLALRAL